MNEGSMACVREVRLDGSGKPYGVVVFREVVVSDRPVEQSNDPHRISGPVTGPGPPSAPTGSGERATGSRTGPSVPTDPESEEDGPDDLDDQDWYIEWGEGDAEGEVGDWVEENRGARSKLGVLAAAGLAPWLRLHELTGQQVKRLRDAVT